MSRKISPKTSVSVPEEERRLLKTDVTGKLLLTVYCGRNCALFIQDSRLVEAVFFQNVPSRIGAVYIGKIKNMTKNIDACFVEIAKGELCFLSLKNASAPYLLNRKYDGRLVEGDELLVQVVQDAQKTKKICVSGQISISNKYFVITAGSMKTGYSLKLDRETKLSIDALLTKAGIFEAGSLSQNSDALLSAPVHASLRSEGIVPESISLPPMGCTVRTKAAEAAAEDEENSALPGYFYTLAGQMFRILNNAKYRSCFSCLKNAPGDLEAILDRLPDQWEIVTDQALMYEQLQKYCAENSIKVNTRFYQDKLLPLSVLYSIESKMETALAARVWLKSGGYLVIESTEALTVIDVNSGKCENNKNSQETYRLINLEAAREAALQLRLRNMSGIIIIDFINMRSHDSNQELLDYLRHLAEKDRVPTKVVDMTPLGLVEITRKRTSRPLREQFRLSGDQNSNKAGAYQNQETYC